MKKNNELVQQAMQLYLVTDQTWVKDSLYSDVKKALNGGVTCVQIREKEISKEVFIEEAFELKKLCAEYNVPFIVNDDVDIALKVNADGIHVGQSDKCASEVRECIGNDKILGVSVQTVEQALKAQKEGADYLGVGAVFSTTTKLDADTVSYEELKSICEAVNIPIVAIGGIHKHNIINLKGSHVGGVAVISAILASDDIEKSSYELKQLVRENIIW